MNTSELERRLPKNIRLTQVCLRLGKVVFAKGIVTDRLGKDTNMKVVYNSEGKAFGRWMTTPVQRGDLILEGWKYKRCEKYDLIITNQQQISIDEPCRGNH